MIVGKYPSLRLRRNRKSSWTRKLIQENTLSPNDFILPIFLIDGVNKKQHIKSMPGVYRYSVDRIGQIIDKAISKGIPMVALFPNTKKSLKNELKQYKEDLTKKTIWLVCNKIDLFEETELLRFKDEIKNSFDSHDLFMISAATGEGTEFLLKKLETEIFRVN